MSYSIDSLKKILHHNSKWIKERIKFLNIKPIEKKHGFCFYDDSIIDMLQNVKIQKEKTLTDYAKEFDVNRNGFYKILKKLNINLFNIEEHLDDIKNYISLSRNEKLWINRDFQRKTKRNLAKELKLTYAQINAYCNKHNLSVKDAYDKKEEILTWFSFSKKERHDFHYKDKINFKYYADKLNVKDYTFRRYCLEQNIKLKDVPNKWEELVDFWSKSESERKTITRNKNIQNFLKENNCVTLDFIVKNTKYHNVSSIGKIIEILNIKPIYYKLNTLVKKEDFDKIKEYEKLHLTSSFSHQENTLKEFMNTLNVSFEKNTRRVIAPKELDIYVPSKKLAIEYNGLYWHSFEIIGDKNYHLNKMNSCNAKNIRLIQLFSDEWIYKTKICESIIKSSLGIYEQKIFARKCEIKKVDNALSRRFLTENHIQGSINGENYGLYYEDELVQIIVLGKSRFKKNEIELYRMCTKLNTQVIGGFSKLMKHQPYDEVISYVDKRLFDGKGYKSTNWKVIGDTKPNYFYVKNKMRYNRMKFQKHKLSKFLKDFDANSTEYQNMLNNGYFTIYDCGNLKLQWKR